MRNLSQKGATLLELMVGVGLTSFLVYFFMVFARNVAMKEKKSLEKVYSKGDSRIFSEFVKKAVSTGDVKFYAHTPSGQRFRLLVSLPGLCRDLNTTSHSCTEDSTLLFVRYNKTTTPSATAICQFKSGSDEALILDLSDESYGTGTLDVSKYSINVNGGSSSMYPSGVINLDKDSLISLFDPPQAYTWLVTERVVRYNLSQRPDGTLSRNDFPEVCKSKLRVDGSRSRSGITFYHLDKLVMIKMIPFTLSQVVEGRGGANPQDMALGEKTYPLRIFNIKVETIGSFYDPVKKEKNLGLSKCKVSNSQLLCDPNHLTIIPKIENFRFDQKYKISLLEDNGNLIGRHKWYEILREGMKPTCAQGINNQDCFIRPLITRTIDDIPYLSANQESKARLLGSSYSLLKQEEIEILRFRFKEQASRKKEEVSVFLQ
jgi:hypothetical protein